MHRRVRVADGTNTRRRCLAVVFVALAVLAHAETITEDEGAGGAVAALSSGATISIFDTLGVVSNFGWWGYDMAMETAGYGEQFYGRASLSSGVLQSVCFNRLRSKFQTGCGGRYIEFLWVLLRHHNTGTT